MSKQQSLPKLTLLGRKIDIRRYSDELMGDAWGDAQAHEQKIRLRKKLMPQAEAHVIMHEIMHVYDDILGLELRHSTIDTIAYALVDLITANPELIQYLATMAAKERL